MIKFTSNLLNIKNINTFSKQIEILRLGLIDYQAAWDLQTEIQKRLIAAKPLELAQNHTLILCQHPHVFTLGKSGEEEHLLVNQEKLKDLNASYYKINRGGDITYHGPGQLVAYPILDLDQIFRDVHKYVRALEEVVILTCRDFGVLAGRIKDFTGVWVDVDSPKPRKICAIGVHLSRWVSLHGLAFNVSTDISYFDYILPCGIDPSQKEVTSLELECKKSLDFEQVVQNFINHFIQVFEFEIKTNHGRKI